MNNVTTTRKVFTKKNMPLKSYSKKIKIKLSQTRVCFGHVIQKDSNCVTSLFRAYIYIYVYIGFIIT